MIACESHLMQSGSKKIWTCLISGRERKAHARVEMRLAPKNPFAVVCSWSQALELKTKSETWFDYWVVPLSCHASDIDTHLALLLLSKRGILVYIQLFSTFALRRLQPQFLGSIFQKPRSKPKSIYIENFIVKVLKSCKSQLFSPSAWKLADHFQGNGGAENKRLGHLESKLMARACGCVFLLFFRQGLRTRFAAFSLRCAPRKLLLRVSTPTI